MQQEGRDNNPQSGETPAEANVRFVRVRIAQPKLKSIQIKLLLSFFSPPLPICDKSQTKITLGNPKYK